MGVDPYTFIDQGHEDFIIRTAMLRKAVELTTEQRRIELEAQAHMIANTFMNLMYG